jgi:hypothetical protein
MRFSRSRIVYVLVLAVVSSMTMSPGSGQAPVTFSFALNGSSFVSCSYWGVTFNANPGQRFIVQWSETAGTPTSLDLYIVTQTSIQETWFCDTGPVELYSDSGAFGSANWAAPSAGGYVVLLVNNNYNSVPGTLSITPINATVTVTPIGYATAREPPLCQANDCARGKS